MKQLKLIKVQRNLSINNQYVDVLNQIAAIHRGIYFLTTCKDAILKNPTSTRVCYAIRYALLRSKVLECYFNPILIIFHVRWKNKASSMHRPRN